MRVALAAALFATPDVLLLDEPSNYLDLEGVIWLKSYIRFYPATVVIVSHDRDLLNEVAGSILHLERGKLALYQGNYDSFERQRREQQALTAKLRKKQEETRRHMEAFVERFRYKASKARQAQSRLKALAKLEPIAAIVEDRVHPFRFPDPAKPLNPPLIRFEGVSAAYDGNPPVLTRLNLRIDDDDRIALLGANGNGKSTFAKLITGKLAPAAGRIHRHSQLGVGYFAQHQLDELEGSATPYDSMRRLMPEASEAERRARLGFHGFGSALADTPADSLSGGEKARLLFALAAFHGPHLLVLDEPTNHLDVDAREALVHALNEFAGAVVLISHDRHLIETCADRLWIAGERTIKPYDGDLEFLCRAGVAAGAARAAGARRPSLAERGGDVAQRPAEPRQSRSAAAAHRRCRIHHDRAQGQDRGPRPRPRGSLDLSRGAAESRRFRPAAQPAGGRSRSRRGAVARAPDHHRCSRHRAGRLSIALSIKLVAALVMPTLR